MNSIQEHYAKEEPRDKSSVEYATVNGVKGYWSVDYPDNRYDNPVRVFNPLTPSTKIENITDGSWPPKEGAYYNGKGPIVKQGEKYGYNETYNEEAYGGNVITHKLFHEVTKPLSEDEAKELKKSTDAKNAARDIAKKNYELNGPNGAPKVLAAVHIAHPRSYTNNPPQVPVGSFVLAFYTLKLRTKDNKWYYTKLFDQVSGDDIATRFDEAKDDKNEFLATYDEYNTFDFNASGFLSKVVAM
jgi:hypothetical protein